MITSELDLWNKALRHVAIGVEVKDPAEKSNAAQACRAFYDDIVDEVEGDFPWPHVVKQAAFALVTDFTSTVAPEWAYNYQIPPDCLRVWRVLPGTGARFDTLDTRIPFREMQGLLYCNLLSPTVEYSQRVVDVTTFSVAFAHALALRLAAEIAPVITGGDTFKFQQTTLQRYQLALAQAAARAANSRAADPPPDSEFIRGRT